MMTCQRVFSLALVFLFCGSIFAAGAWAQGEDENQQEQEEGKKDEKQNDPWDAPKTDTGEPSISADKIEVVIPSGYPVAEVDRPLALPPLTLEPDLTFRLDFVDEGDNWFSMRTGAGFGIIDNLEAGMHFPLMVAPDVRGGDLEFYALYDLSSLIGGGFNLAGRLRMAAPMSNRFSYWWGDFGMLAEILAKFKFHDMMAVTGRAGIGFIVGDNRGYDWDAFLMHLEGGLLFQAIEPLALHLLFGLVVYAGDIDEVLLPLTMRVQYTVIHDLDIFVDTGFIDLTDVADPWILTMIVGASYRIGF